jgi:hypothetical protein
VTPAGYSGTPLAKKLGVKDGGRVWLKGAPAGFEKTLEGMPEGAATVRTAKTGAAYDVIVLFVKNKSALTKEFAAAAKRLASHGGLWIAWPKKASGVATDLTEDGVRAVGLPTGLVDNKVCAIDEIWSGLRFMRRRSSRAAP